MSNLPLSLVLAVHIDILSSSSGWRTGSFSTHFATSSSRLAVISLTLLWRMMTYPPLGQLRAWSTLFDFPHIQVIGMALGLHPYLKACTSRKSLLWIAKSCSSIGSAGRCPFLLCKGHGSLRCCIQSIANVLGLLLLSHLVLFFCVFGYSFSCFISIWAWLCSVPRWIASVRGFVTDLDGA